MDRLKASLLGESAMLLCTTSGAVVPLVPEERYDDIGSGLLEAPIVIRPMGGSSGKKGGGGKKKGIASPRMSSFEGFLPLAALLRGTD